MPQPRPADGLGDDGKGSRSSHFTRTLTHAPRARSGWVWVGKGIEVEECQVREGVGYSGMGREVGGS